MRKKIVTEVVLFAVTIGSRFLTTNSPILTVFRQSLSSRSFGGWSIVLSRHEIATASSSCTSTYLRIFRTVAACERFHTVAGCSYARAHVALRT